MAGKILHTPVTVGQNVQQGDVVLVLETMKMEYPLQATSTAQITQIHVSEGQVVQVNQPLISLLSIST
jgi:biotin carboxyl carrier protein